MYSVKEIRDWKRESKERKKKRTKKGAPKEEEGVVYNTECKECEKVYIGGNKFMLEREKHMKDIQYNTIAKHVKEREHLISWEMMVCLEMEKKNVS